MSDGMTTNTRPSYYMPIYYGEPIDLGGGRMKTALEILDEMAGRAPYVNKYDELKVIYRELDRCIAALRYVEKHSDDVTLRRGVEKILRGEK